MPNDLIDTAVKLISRFPLWMTRLFERVEEVMMHPIRLREHADEEVERLVLEQRRDRLRAGI